MCVTFRPAAVDNHDFCLSLNCQTAAIYASTEAIDKDCMPSLGMATSRHAAAFCLLIGVIIMVLFHTFAWVDFAGHSTGVLLQVREVTGTFTETSLKHRYKCTSCISQMSNAPNFSTI